MKYLFLPEALLEYEESALYYAAIDKHLAGTFVSQIESAIRRMQRNPSAHAVVAENVRRCLVKRFPFGIYFLIEDDQMLIVAVMHMSRKPNYWKDRVSEGSSSYSAEAPDENNV